MYTYWHECSDPGPNHTDVHHLMAIATLLRESGIARAGDVARHLSLSRGEVEGHLSDLTDRGLVIRPQKKQYALSSEGVDVVNSVLAKRRILRGFFEDILKVPRDLAATDACKIEHLLSAETADRLVTFMGEYLSGTGQIDGFRRALEDYAGAARILRDKLSTDDSDRDSPSADGQPPSSLQP